LFEGSVEASILDGDCKVSGQRLEQLDVFTGKKVAFDGLAEG
jgi:hypothetical protein